MRQKVMTYTEEMSDQGGAVIPWSGCITRSSTLSKRALLDIVLGEVTHCFQWLLQYGLYRVVSREWLGRCFIFMFSFGFFFDSSSATERPWLESSPTASPSLQLSMGNSRPPGGYLVPSEFSNAVQDVSLLSHFQTPGLQIVTLSGLENSPAEPQQEPAASSSARAYLTYGRANRGSSSPREETQATFVGNSSISPKTMSSSVTSAEDDGFLTQNFLTVASGHNSQNSAAQQHHGGNLHAQPPLPEKKRSSEGDRSFASVSPSSSGFSSPHSGSTISIPFPNVLPDFSKMLSTSPVAGRFCIREMQNTLCVIWVYKKHLGDFKSGGGGGSNGMKMSQRTAMFAVSGASSLALDEKAAARFFLCLFSASVSQGQPAFWTAKASALESNFF